MPIAVFQNMRAVIRAEQLCRSNEIRVAVMPLPEDLSSECGMCLHIEEYSCEFFNKLMMQASISVKIYDKI